MHAVGMYGAHAALYDPLYSQKDYAGEAAALTDLLRSRGIPDGARLLDVCCGTGRHLAHLQQTYAVAGCDGSAAMLALARARLPDSVPLWQADLLSLQVDAPFDVVTCLFSSIGYLPDLDALTAGVARLAAAVAPGGLLLIEPWISPDQARPGQAAQHTHDGPDLKIVRSVVPRIVGRRMRLDFAWMVAQTDRPVETFRERHELFLATPEELQEAMALAGLQVDSPDIAWSARGLWAGQRPLPT